jgi:hypothetical protein
VKVLTVEVLAWLELRMVGMRARKGALQMGVLSQDSMTTPDINLYSYVDQFEEYRGESD